MTKAEKDLLDCYAKIMTSKSNNRAVLEAGFILAADAMGYKMDCFAATDGSRAVCIMKGDDLYAMQTIIAGVQRDDSCRRNNRVYRAMSG